MLNLFVFRDSVKLQVKTTYNYSKTTVVIVCLFAVSFGYKIICIQNIIIRKEQKEQQQQQQHRQQQ